MSTLTSPPPAAGILTLDPKIDKLDPASIKILYTLYYRQGSNPHPQFTSFFYPSRDMKVVTDRVKRFCEVMNYRFVYVRPAIIDLDKEENFLQQRDN